jgi:hypothetical protein
MAKVTVIKPFVGSSEELQKFGGQVPKDLEHADRMTEDEKAGFRGVITRGTVMDVDDKRAKELVAKGVVTEGEKKKDTAATEKNKKAGPGK